MNTRDAANTIIAIGQTIATVVPEPYGALIRIASAAISAATIALDNGVSEATLIKSIHRIQRISA